MPKPIGNRIMQGDRRVIIVSLQHQSNECVARFGFGSDPAIVPSESSVALAVQIHGESSVWATRVAVFSSMGGAGGFLPWTHPMENESMVKTEFNLLTYFFCGATLLVN
ncbi:MAG: hypothetical protein AB8B55_11480 [Mariniblastus sp.]